jgi:hypothetical protein
MAWTVIYHDDFLVEFAAFSEAVQDNVLTMAELLTLTGPALGRPHADTLTGSQHPNMKELRFRADDGVWRVAFAFDPQRRAIILVAGDKSGVAQARFYKRLIARADARFSAHLKSMKDI